ncbi:arachidonate 5-lipoxygenase-like, partial [Paramuricea clavata]
KCRRLSGWFRRKPKPAADDYYEDCCQGWTDKGPLGCLKKTCIALPQKVPQQIGKRRMCPAKRLFNLVEQNIFYKLTTPLSEPLIYLNETTNLFEAVPFPLLNQPSSKVVLRSVLSPTLDEQGWVIRYLGMAQRNTKLVEKTMEPENLQPFTKYSDHGQLLKSYREEQSKPIIAFKIPGLEQTFNLIPMAKYMKYPSQELPFKDIIHQEAWQSDDVFTQQRLAGLNPMSLRKMTIEDFNQDFVNRTYDWDAAMQRALGKKSTFSE